MKDPNHFLFSPTVFCGGRNYMQECGRSDKRNARDWSIQEVYLLCLNASLIILDHWCLSWMYWGLHIKMSCLWRRVARSDGQKLARSDGQKSLKHRVFLHNGKGIVDTTTLEKKSLQPSACWVVKWHSIKTVIKLPPVISLHCWYPRKTVG